MAGVSEGTVDRVLHKRGDVSARSLEAVNKVLKEINYTPNILARSLASKKVFRFVYLIPKNEHGDYWAAVEAGFEKAMPEFEGYNVTYDRIYFDQFDVKSFVEAINRVLNDLPQGVIMAPIFSAETLEFTAQLSQLNIPFSFIDSLVDDNRFFFFFLQNSVLSGYIAAKFLTEDLKEGDSILVIRTRRKGSVSNQTKSRFIGFKNYLAENKLSEKFKLIEVEFVDDNEEINISHLKTLFEGQNNIKAAITFNSKVFRLAMKLEKLGITDIKLIGYDLLAENINYLKKGIIDLLIAQHPEKQSYLSVKDMCRKLVFGQEIKQINYMPIDILIKENIDSYIQFVD